MNPNITQSKKFDHLHLIYHFTVTLKLRSQVAKYWKLGRYFPYCIRHRTIETTTVKLVIEKNLRIYWILFIQFMVGESRHFHFWSQAKPSPRYLSSHTYIRQKEINHTYPQATVLWKISSYSRKERRRRGEWVFTLPIITISPFNLWCQKLYRRWFMIK